MYIPVFETSCFLKNQIKGARQNVSYHPRWICQEWRATFLIKLQKLECFWDWKRLVWKIRKMKIRSTHTYFEKSLFKTYLRTGKMILVYSWGLHSPTRNNTGSNTAAKTSWLRISCSSKGHVCWNQSFWNIIKKNWLKKVISSWHCLQNYQV